MNWMPDENLPDEAIEMNAIGGVDIPTALRVLAHLTSRHGAADPMLHPGTTIVAHTGDGTYGTVLLSRKWVGFPNFDERIDDGVLEMVVVNSDEGS